MCLTPITITRQQAGKYYLNNVPCNNCLECIKDKQNEYIIRTIEEQRKRGSMVFFTLTYSPSALPMKDNYEIDEESGEIISESEVQTLRRSDVRKWKLTYEQRYRRHGIKLDYGYLICGEYGCKTQRPHYHGIFLGLSKEVVDDIMKDWSDNYGFVVYNYIPPIVKDVEKVARYCSKYICKDKEHNNVPEGAEKPRKQTSKFYGLPEPDRWQKMVDYYTCKDMIEYDIDDIHFSWQDGYRLAHEIIKRRKYNLGNGKEFKLPNYYKRKIFYVKDAFGKERSSQVQRLVTYHVQCDFDKNFKEELHNLATIYDFREYVEAVDCYNMVHEDSCKSREARYAKDNLRYYSKSFC